MEMGKVLKPVAKIAKKSKSTKAIGKSVYKVVIKAKSVIRKVTKKVGKKVTKIYGKVKCKITKKGCFTAGTLISTQNGDAPIEDVEDFHTYFLSDASVLVHNNGCIPDKAKKVVNEVKNNNGKAPKVYVGGRTFKNHEKKLPINNTYREYDINPKTKGVNRGEERIVIGSDGSVWYTKDHYKSFIRMELGEDMEINLSKVHQLRVANINENITKLISSFDNEFKTIEIDCINCKDKDSLLKVIANKFDFPDYFSYNWDSLDECLSDIEWINSNVILILKNIEYLLINQPELLEIFFDIILNLLEEMRLNQCCDESITSSNLFQLIIITKNIELLRRNWIKYRIII